MYKRVMSRFLVICLLTSFVAIAINGCGKEEEKTAYKIGAIFATTGPAAALGVPEKNTADMLEEQINAAGGIDGHQVDIIVYDTEGLEATARTRIDKLINLDQVAAIVGPTRSGTSLGILDLIEEAQIPLVSCAASVKIVEPVAERKWVFKTPQSDVLMGTVIRNYLQAQNIAKVAIITVANPFGASGKAELKKLLPPAGIEIVAEEEFGDKDTDTSGQLTKIGATDAQAVICWSTTGGGAVVTKNMKGDLKMEIPLIMSHGVASKAYINLAGEAANGVVLPAGKLLVASDLPDTDPQKAVLLKYASDYRKKFNEETNTFGGHAWDSINLVVNAMKKVGDDKAKIRDEIEKTTNFVGTGGVFNFSATDHNGLTEQGVVMVKIVDGEWTLLE
jgi:branched-chain amino acid transport system substrate-binding protein